MMDVILRETLYDDSLDVMNFLNEVVLRYPEAISFAPGRPSEAFFEVESSLRMVECYAEHRAALEGRPPAQVFKELGQYGQTNGVIRDLIAGHLQRDEGIEVPPEAIIATTGCQEAMLILMMGLFDPRRDSLLVSDPTYIGITGLAQILGVRIEPVPTRESGLEPKEVSRAIERTKASGKRPKAIYVIPDFNNPLGTSVSIENRRQLLQLARENRILILEDNPYGMFAYDGTQLPTLKALEGSEAAEHDPVVVYLGSFSKTLFPGLRLGYLVADQRVHGLAKGASRLMAEELSKVKSLTTVNTSPIVQAIVGGVLAENNGSLRRLVEEKLPFYKGNRDTMLRCLEEFLGSDGRERDVDWNYPAGGFFLTLSLPFEFDERRLESCAKDYGVICCPMSFFSLQKGRERQVRLSFSYVSQAQIEEGVRRLARFVDDQLH